MTHETLDVRGQLCPIPVIRTQNKVKSLKVGDILDVICTDPGALSDIPSWCRIHGHKVLDSQTGEDEIIISIQIEET